MKTTRKRLLNIVITMSVVINLALLGGLSYIALMNNHVNQLCAAMNLPMVIYVNNATEVSGAAPGIKSHVKS
jgi:hypothetical protein